MLRNKRTNNFMRNTGVDSVSSLAKELDKERNKYKNLLTENNSIIRKLSQVKSQLEERFVEIAFLTQELEMYRRESSENKISFRQEEIGSKFNLSKLQEDTNNIDSTNKNYLQAIKKMLPKVRGIKSILNNPERASRELRLLIGSGFFDARWYLSNNTDVCANRTMRENPALHFLNYGGFEGRDPGPNFSISEYVEEHPEVRDLGINPLIHYISTNR